MMQMNSNGSLMVVPGSHKLGDLPCISKPNFDKDDSGRNYIKSHQLEMIVNT